MAIETLYIVSPAGEVDSFFPHDTEAPFPSLPPGWVATWTPPAPSAPAIRRITFAAWLARLTSEEFALMRTNPVLDKTFATKQLEFPPPPVINLDSPELVPLMAIARSLGLSEERIAILLADGTPEEAA